MYACVCVRERERERERDEEGGIEMTLTITEEQCMCMWLSWHQPFYELQQPLGALCPEMLHLTCVDHAAPTPNTHTHTCRQCTDQYRHSVLIGLDA